MRNQTFFALALAAIILLSACGTAPRTAVSPGFPPTETGPEATEGRDRPVSSDTPIATQEPPKPVAFQAELAVIESMDIQTLDTSPAQVFVVLEGYLPSSCEKMGTTSQSLDATSKTFSISVTMIETGERNCLTAIRRFEDTVALKVDGLPEGKYTVTANGITGAFELKQSSHAEVDPASVTPVDTSVITGQAVVSRVRLNVPDSYPVVIEAEIIGWLPDSCTTISRVEQTFDPAAHTFTLDVLTTRPRAAACMTGSYDFKEHASLALYAMPAGTYTVIANGRTATVDVQRGDILPLTPQP